MITKEIDINGEKFRLMLTEQIINQVNNLKTLYSAAYDDPESFEHVSAEISSTIQEISNAVEPKPGSNHLDDLIQQVIKIDARFWITFCDHFRSIVVPQLDTFWLLY